MARCQVKDILRYIAPSGGDAGICATTESGKQKLIHQLDLTLWATVKRIDDDGTLFEWGMPVVASCFAMPFDMREARQIFVNGAPTIQRDKWFLARLSSGLKSCGSPCGPLEIDDLGDFAIPQPLPKIRPIRIALVAEFDSDAGKEVTLEIVNEYGERVKEVLTLVAGQQPVLSESAAYDVTFVGKPETDGPIKMQLSYDNGMRFPFAVYAPKVRQGAFRRKRLPRRFAGCNEVVVRGKLRYFPISSENDIIPFSDPIGLRWAMQAVAAQDKRDEGDYNSKMAAALNEFWKEMADADPASNVAPVQFLSGFGNHSFSRHGRCWS